MTEPEISTEAKLERLLSHTLNNLDSNTLYDIIAYGDDISGTEPLEGAAKDAFETWLTEDLSNAEGAKLLSDHPEVLHALEQEALWMFDQTAAEDRELGGLSGHLRGVENAVESLPGWLVPQYIEMQVDRAEASTFDHPDAWEELIGLLQIEYTHDHYPEGRDPMDNRAERRSAWDELLKFTNYTTHITYDVDDYRHTDEFTGWYQSSTDSHNAAVRRLTDAADYVKAETVPNERYHPESFQPPLEDLADFVYYR